MNNTIATLGPPGTYSELATKQYLAKHQLDLNVAYFSTISKSLNAIGDTARLGILPIENFSEGFVNIVLDHLISAPLYICAELILPIQFSLVSHCENVQDIKTIYVQFVAKGQCGEYLDKLEGVQFIATESNTQTLELIAGKKDCAAVIPHHYLMDKHFQYSVDNITDYANNQTRFLLFSDQPQLLDKRQLGNYKTSIVVFFHEDYPGFLEGILHSFTQRGINLTSLVSRPTRRNFGNYHFFIDLDGHQQDPLIQEAFSEIQQRFKMKIFGSYLKSALDIG